MRALVFVFAMLAAGCTQPAPPPPPGTVQENVARLLTPETRTILTGANAMTLAHQCSRPSPGPVSAQWTPTAADIASLEPTLASVIAAHLQAAGSQASGKRQTRIIRSIGARKPSASATAVRSLLASATT